MKRESPRKVKIVFAFGVIGSKPHKQKKNTQQTGKKEKKKIKYRKKLAGILKRTEYNDHKEQNREKDKWSNQAASGLWQSGF